MFNSKFKDGLMKGGTLKCMLVADRKSEHWYLRVVGISINSCFLCYAQGWDCQSMAFFSRCYPILCLGSIKILAPLTVRISFTITFI